MAVLRYKYRSVGTDSKLVPSKGIGESRCVGTLANEMQWEAWLGE